MVLPPRGGGRVGRRRTSFCERATSNGGPFVISGVLSRARSSSTAGAAAPSFHRPAPRSRRLSAPDATVGRGGDGREDGQEMDKVSEGTELASVAVNEVRLVGRLSRDPEMRVLPSGDQMWTFRVVVPRAPGGRTEQSVDVLDCAVWGGRVRASVASWSADDVVEVAGPLRKRFFSSGGGPGLAGRGRGDVRPAGEASRHSSRRDRMSTPDARFGLERRRLLGQQPVPPGPPGRRGRSRAPASGSRRPVPCGAGRAPRRPSGGNPSRRSASPSAGSSSSCSTSTAARSGGQRPA